MKNYSCNENQIVYIVNDVYNFFGKYNGGKKPIPHAVLPLRSGPMLHEIKEIIYVHKKLVIYFNEYL